MDNLKSYKCTGCGGNLIKNDETGRWGCPYCGAQYNLVENNGFEYLNFVEIEKKIDKKVDECVDKKADKIANLDYSINKKIGQSDEKELLLQKGVKLQKHIKVNKICGICLISIAIIMVLLRLFGATITYIELFGIPLTLIFPIIAIPLAINMLKKAKRCKFAICNECNAFLNLPNIDYKLLNKKRITEKQTQLNIQFSNVCECCGHKSEWQENCTFNHNKENDNSVVKHYLQNIYNLKENKNAFNSANINASAKQFKQNNSNVKPIFSVCVLCCLFIFQCVQLFTILPFQYYSLFCSSSTVRILPTIKHIPDYAFDHIEKIETVIIPNSVTTIGEHAFLCCYDLNSIIISNSVTTIGSDAFGSCSKLSSITIPNSVTYIGDFAFSHCSKLSLITISNSVTNIGKYTFENCYDLNSVTIPNSVKEIGNSAFSGCSKLSSISIPDSVTSIGSSAFYYCSNLKRVDYNGTIEQWNKIDFGNYDANPLDNGADLYINGEKVTF